LMWQTAELPIVSNQNLLVNWDSGFKVLVLQVDS
jgi:hypothetical protein